jgi:tetratricopeptide (TPR) repeat protein
MQIGIVYSRLFQFDKAIPEYEKALEIYKKWDSKPLGVIYYTFLGEAYHKNGLYRKEKEIYEKGVKDFPKEFDLPVRQAILALTLKDTVEANRYIARCNSLMKDLSFSDAAIMTRIANIYYEADILDRAEELYQKALSADSENPARLNNLAYFLIDKDQDVKKGLELVDKALKLRPDNFVSLQIKGWGLYKQGKFKEAFNLLQTSWDLRKKYSVYYHEAYLHLQEAKKAVAALKNN